MRWDAFPVSPSAQNPIAVKKVRPKPVGQASMG
jgi:hypothetical protein